MKAKETKKTKKTTAKKPATTKKAVKKPVAKVKKTPKTKKAVKTTAKTPKKTAVKRSEPKKTSKNINQKSNKQQKKPIYKKTTDKVGDILINPAGVKYKITSERYAPTTGYDDGKLKIRVLTIQPDKKTGLPAFETLDSNIKNYRDIKILTRLNHGKKK